MVIQIILMIFSIFSAVAYSQEQRDPELLEWLPEENMKYVYYYEENEHFRNCPSDIREKYFRPSTKLRSEEAPDDLPYMLKDRWENYLCGTLVKVTLKKRMPTDDLDAEDSNWGGIGFGDSVYSVNEEYVFFKAYSFQGLDILLKKTFREGQVSKLGRNYKGFSLYTFRPRDKSYQIYLAQINDNILLVAEKESQLFKMILAGTGEYPNYRDSDTYREVKAHQTLAKTKWTIIDSGPFWDQVKQYFLNNDPGNPVYVEDAETQLESKRIDVKSEKWHKDGFLEEVNTSIFATREEAEAELANESDRKVQRRHANSRSKEALGLVEFVDSNTTVKLAGSCLIRTVKYPPEYFYKRLKFMTDMEELRKEKEEEKRSKAEESQR